MGTREEAARDDAYITVTLTFEGDVRVMINGQHHLNDTGEFGRAMQLCANALSVKLTEGLSHDAQKLLDRSAP